MNRILLTVGVCVLFAFSACTRGGQSGGTQGKSGDLKNIVLWEQDDASIASYIDSVINAFKALPENKGLQVTRVHYSTEDLRQQFQTASIAGTMPDLIMTPPDPAGVFSVSGFILPTNEVFDLSRYDQNAVGAVTLNGKAWGVPITKGNHLMLFYNKKFVKKPPTSTDELVSYCEKELKGQGADHCIAFNQGEPFWFVPWLSAFGGWPIENKAPALDTPAMLSALRFYTDLKFKKKIMPQECDYNCTDTLFKERKVAMIINGDWAMSIYKDALKEDFGVTRIPMVSATKKWPAPMISGKYFMLSSALKGEKLDLIKRFVIFYTNKQNQVEQLQKIGRLPSLTEAAQSPELKDPLFQASLDQISVGRPMPGETEMRAIWDAMRPKLGQVMNGTISPEDAAKKMQEDALNKIKEMNK
jgi:arabinogalactan oligomer/maltooligosaccharide transport system substrate-binding protein